MSSFPEHTTYCHRQRIAAGDPAAANASTLFGAVGEWAPPFAFVLRPSLCLTMVMQVYAPAPVLPHVGVARGAAGQHACAPIPQVHPINIKKKVVASLWSHVCGFMSVGSCLWVHVCGRMPVGSCLWSHVCGFMSVVACLWVHVCGRRVLPATCDYCFTRAAAFGCTCVQLW